MTYSINILEFNILLKSAFMIILQNSINKELLLMFFSSNPENNLLLIPLKDNSYTIIWKIMFEILFTSVKKGIQLHQVCLIIQPFELYDYYKELSTCELNHYNNQLIQLFIESIFNNKVDSYFLNTVIYLLSEADEEKYKPIILFLTKIIT